MKYITTLILALLFLNGVAQNSQNVKGQVTDKNTLQSLPGANVFVILENDEIKGGSTDLDGNFVLNNIPLGRHIFQCSFIGYENWVSGNIEVTSAKEVILNIELSPAVFTTAEEVIVQADRMGGTTNNEFTMVSGRSFTSEETQRFAGSINDPGRMALSMPGVQFSNNDNENTMIIRGNAPFGFAWRLEGMEMPNPNHFADAGTSGGGVSALSIFVLGESDFINGAFAAEYGNATSGVVDMHFRKGNKEAYEHRFQIGVMGIDLASEGPLNKKKGNASYLINYRLSTLDILSALGVHVVQPNVFINYQDLSFNLNFPISKKTFFNIYGMGGLSKEHKVSDPEGVKYADWRKYATPTNLGVAGATLTHLINSKSYLYSAVSIGGNYLKWDEDTVANDNTAFAVKNELYNTTTLTGTVQYNRQFSNRLNTKTGVFLTNYFYNVNSEYYNHIYDKKITLYNGNESPLLVSAFTQGIFNINPKLDFQFGVHSQFLAASNDMTLEPRFGLTLKPAIGSLLTLAYGHHSKMLPWSVYNTHIYNSNTDSYDVVNQNLSFMKARHISLMYNQHFNKSFRLRIEPFYQMLYDIPVSIDPTSTVAALNEEPDFIAEEMANTGEGRNYGVETTIEKFFSNQFFFLVSSSIFKSEYKTNNGGADLWYSTRYNTGYSGAITLGKEWALLNDKMLEIGGRVISSGGMRYSPIDNAASMETGRLIFHQDDPYSLSLDNYFRTDLRIAFRKNNEKNSWKLSFDVQNLTNHKNVRRPYYDRRLGDLNFDPQASFTPAISYILDF